MYCNALLNPSLTVQRKHIAVVQPDLPPPPPYVCAASAPGLDTIAHSFVTVKGEQHAVRILTF